MIATRPAVLIDRADGVVGFARVGRAALIVLLALIYSGAYLFLVTFSPTLLYAFYVVILGFTFVCWYFDPPGTHSLVAVAPYLVWLVLYSLWGTLISPYPGLVQLEVIRLLMRNFLFIIALVVALPDASAFRWFARAVYIAVIANCAVSLYETIQPSLIRDITYLLNSAAVSNSDVLRPAGLFPNPDETVYALLIAILIAGRDRGILSWVARVAAVVGIYLAASRTGGLLLGLYLVMWLAHRLTQIRLTLGRLTALTCGAFIAIFVIISAAEVSGQGTISFDLSNNYALSRMFDLSERGTAAGSGRGVVAAAALEAARDAPVQGNGIFAFQELYRGITPEISLGAHNMYLVVWGEIGVIGLASYLVVLGVGLLRLLDTRLLSIDRLIGGLLWLSILLIGATWHTQFTAVGGMLYTGLVYYYPQLARRVRALGASGDGRPPGGPL